MYQSLHKSSHTLNYCAKEGVIEAEILVLQYLIPEGQYNTVTCARCVRQSNANVPDVTTKLLAAGIHKG